MACTLHMAWDERLTDYHFGPGHPMAPVRVELTMRLAHDFGLWNQPGLTMAAPAPATDAELRLVHDEPYIAAVEEVSRWARPHPDANGGLDASQLHVAHMFGLGTEDNPVFPGMHEASALVAGATLAAARAAWSGSAGHGASIAGGMHHAMAGHASGFGVYNDPAIAIAWLLGQGAERIAYVDIDAHHGDGVQAAFYADPRVLTISLHEHPATLFPFTGLPAETGGPGAEVSAVNVALPAGQPISPETPTPLTWREYVAHRTALAAPEQMTDGAPATFAPFESGYDPAAPADTAIMATRNAVFPEHGLMPL